MERNNIQFRKPILPAGKLAHDLLSFGEQQYEQNGVALDRFVTCITGCENDKANCGVYQLFVMFVRTLAAKSSVEGADGEAVEGCRKICDLMGWPPHQV